MDSLIVLVLAVCMWNGQNIPNLRAFWVLM